MNLVDEVAQSVVGDHVGKYQITSIDMGKADSASGNDLRLALFVYRCGIDARLEQMP